MHKNWKVDSAKGLIYGRGGRPIGTINSEGYVCLREWFGSKASGSRALKAHRVIWESVHGPIPAGLVINHINGVKYDNRIANLECVTVAENATHASRGGLLNCFSGQNHFRAKLTDDKVRAIRSYGMEYSNCELGRMFGVHNSRIRDIRLGIAWKHVA